MEERGELKHRILDAASQEFLEKGFSNSTTRSIARRAATSESSMFRYFETKFDLLTAVLQSGWRSLSEFVMPEVERTKSPSEGLRILGRRMLQFYKERPGLGVLLLSEGWVSGPSSIALDKSVASAFLSEDTRRFVKKVGDLIEVGQATGEIRETASPTAVREAFFGIVEGLAFGWYLATHTDYQAPYTIDEAISVLERFLRGLRGD